MLQGLNLIEKTIQDFLQKFHCTAKAGIDFCYYPELNQIEYCFVISNKDKTDFLNSIEIWQPTVQADCFLWSLLHELGHHMTEDILTEQEIAQSEREKTKGNYYKAMDEIYATLWAIEYTETHVKTLMQFWNTLQPLILNFYKINKIS